MRMVSYVTYGPREYLTLFWCTGCGALGSQRYDGTGEHWELPARLSQTKGAPRRKRLRPGQPEGIPGKKKGPTKKRGRLAPI